MKISPLEIIRFEKLINMLIEENKLEYIEIKKKFSKIIIVPEKEIIVKVIKGSEIYRKDFKEIPDKKEAITVFLECEEGMKIGG